MPSSWAASSSLGVSHLYYPKHVMWSTRNTNLWNSLYICMTISRSISMCLHLDIFGTLKKSWMGFPTFLMVSKDLQKSRIWGPGCHALHPNRALLSHLGICWAIWELCWRMLELCWTILEPWRSRTSKLWYQIAEWSTYLRLVNRELRQMKTLCYNFNGFTLWQWRDEIHLFM